MVSNRIKRMDARCRPEPVLEPIRERPEDTDILDARLKRTGTRKKRVLNMADKLGVTITELDHGVLEYEGKKYTTRHYLRLYNRLYGAYRRLPT